jgi:hypothetical protein
MRKGRKGDWQIMKICAGDRPFLLSEMESDRAFHYRRSLASEADVQQFVRDHHLVLIETFTHGTWSTRLYRPRAGRPSLNRKHFPEHR